MADLRERPAWRDPDVDVDTSASRRLREAGVAELVQEYARLGGNAHGVGEVCAGLWVQVDAQLVRMVDVRPAHGPRVEIQAAEVDRPDEVGHVDRTQLPRAPAAGEGHRHRLHPVGERLGDALLVEKLAARAVGVPLEHGWSLANAAERPWTDGQVVLNQVQLGLAPCGEKHLLRIGHADGASVDLNLGVCSGQDRRQV